MERNELVYILTVSNLHVELWACGDWLLRLFALLSLHLLLCSMQCDRESLQAVWPACGLHILKYWSRHTTGLHFASCGTCRLVSNHGCCESVHAALSGAPCDIVQTRRPYQLVMSGDWYPSLLHCPQGCSMASWLPWGGDTVVRAASAPVQTQKQVATMSALAQKHSSWPHLGLHPAPLGSTAEWNTCRPRWGGKARCTPADRRTCTRADHICVPPTNLTLLEYTADYGGPEALLLHLDCILLILCQSSSKCADVAGQGVALSAGVCALVEPAVQACHCRAQRPGAHLLLLCQQCFASSDAWLLHFDSFESD